jgi:hypothetical protein
MQLLESGPGQLGARLGHRAAVNRFGLGPKTAVSSLAKKRAGFTVNALAFPASRQR